MPRELVKGRTPHLGAIPRSDRDERRTRLAPHRLKVELECTQRVPDERVHLQRVRAGLEGLTLRMAQLDVARSHARDVEWCRLDVYQQRKHIERAHCRALEQAERREHDVAVRVEYRVLQAAPRCVDRGQRHITRLHEAREPWEHSPAAGGEEAGHRIAQRF